MGLAPASGSCGVYCYCFVVRFYGDNILDKSTLKVTKCPLANYGLRHFSFGGWVQRLG